MTLAPAFPVRARAPAPPGPPADRHRRGDDAPEDTGLERVDDAALADAMATLPPAQREVLLLRYRDVRRTSVAAWAVTFLVVLAHAGVVAARIAHVRRLVPVGVMPAGAVFETAMPLILVVGTISLLVATLSTVGVFLRLRTASLTEIQLRLAALEEMIRSGERG